MDQAQKLIEQLRFKARDYCDNPKASEPARLDSMLGKLFSDVRSGADNDRLIHSVEQLEDFMDNLKRTQGIFSPEHIDDMYDRCQELERIFRNMR